MIGVKIKDRTRKIKVKANPHTAALCPSTTYVQEIEEKTKDRTRKKEKFRIYPASLKWIFFDKKFIIKLH